MGGKGQQRVIAVFGSSSPEAGSEAYEQARRLGRMLAEAGLAVSTGGYSGVMAAASQGAAEVGGHVIGVTCDQIESFRPLGPNEWVLEEVRRPTLRERLLHLVDHNDGMVVLPGGIGTLSEMALAWSFLQVGEIPPRPLVVVGHLWQATIEAFVRPEYVAASHLTLIHVVDTPEEAVDFIVRRTS
ncbi:MAG: LOG family protein [Chloroflexi bacterium]|nr:LOG family protein [Chloroflexota bacterium]MCI0580804.1 LOG family protein [Chloroflexota bacterium]MCI0648452.1 LOG family protein [Chloroflexota bacterium]MCI0727580.1 LOG family protein [Chloroflexota bacterium]